jgi:hypothetical protein
MPAVRPTDAAFHHCSLAVADATSLGRVTTAVSSLQGASVGISPPGVHGRPPPSRASCRSRSRSQPAHRVLDLPIDDSVACLASHAVLTKRLHVAKETPVNTRACWATEIRGNGPRRRMIVLAAKCNAWDGFFGFAGLHGRRNGRKRGAKQGRRGPLGDRIQFLTRMSPEIERRIRPAAVESNRVA